MGRSKRRKKPDIEDIEIHIEYADPNDQEAKRRRTLALRELLARRPTGPASGENENDPPAEEAGGPNK